MLTPTQHQSANLYIKVQIYFDVKVISCLEYVSTKYAVNNNFILLELKWLLRKEFE